MKTQNSQMRSFKHSFYVIIYSELINSIEEVIPYIYFHVHVMVNLFFLQNVFHHFKRKLNVC